MEQSAGYRVGNLDDIDARFKCTHCKLLLRDPMQGDCGHRYCSNCVKSKFSEALLNNKPSICEACDEEDDTQITPDRSYPDLAIKREINKNLNVQCPFAPCDETMRLPKLENHMAECQYRPEQCENCGDTIPLTHMQQHLETECPMRDVTCEKCGEMIGFDQLEEHKAKTCIGNTKACQFCLARVKDSDEDMEKHLIDECPVGWHNSKSCPYECNELGDDWQRHREDNYLLHLDRTMAQLKKLEADLRNGKLSADTATVPPAAAAAASVNRGALTATNIGQQAIVGNDYEYDSTNDLLRQLKVRLGRVEAEYKKLSITQFNTDDPNFQSFFQHLQNSLKENSEVNNLLSEIKSKFEILSDKLRQYEDHCKRSLQSHLDYDKKYQELLKLLAYKEVKIHELERRVEVLESSSYDGVLVWRITDVARRKEEAREGKVCSIYSPPFYTGKTGYKMCGRLYLNGDGNGKNTHISLFFVIMRGQFDSLLPWPFTKKVSMMLLDQNNDQHVIDAFKPEPTSSSFKKPVTDMNIASGCPLFMPINDFESSSHGYVKDDTMFIKFIVDKSDLPT